MQMAKKSVEIVLIPFIAGSAVVPLLPQQAKLPKLPPTPAIATRIQLHSAQTQRSYQARVERGRVNGKADC